MRKNIHPDVKTVKFICSCGKEFEVESAVVDDEVRMEICSNCHPFYTGEERILKTGAVDKFYARMEKSKKLKK